MNEKIEKTVPRLTVEITEQQQEGLKKLKWGLRKPLFHTIIDQVIEIVSEYGDLGVYAITSKKVKLLDIMKASEEREVQDEHKGSTSEHPNSSTH
jgi:hypothetical protein